MTFLNNEFRWSSQLGKGKYFNWLGNFKGFYKPEVSVGLHALGEAGQKSK